jgi:hypothetical protein
MYDLVNKQYRTGRTLIQNKYSSLIRKDLWPKFFWDLYPLGQDYFHELNPYFLFNFTSIALLKFSDLFTVRDGYVGLANFLLTNLTHIQKNKTSFLIPPHFAPLLPPNSLDRFAAWSICHPDKIEITEAKRVIIFAFLAEQYIGPIEQLKERFQVLSQIPQNTKIEIWAPVRRDPLQLQHKESIIVHQVVDIIREVLPNREIEWIDGEDFFENSNFRETYVFDAAFDQLLVGDNYLHYFVLSKGGSVNLVPKAAPSDSFFDLDLSIHHKLHVHPLPKVQSNLFMDLLYYKKQAAGRDLMFDTVFHGILREGLRKVT